MSDFSLRDEFGDFLVKEGHANTEIVVLDADLSSSTRTNKFAQKYPDRFFNMGIAEQNAMGTAIGFAISGKIPIVSGFSIFTTGRAWEFIRLACHDNLNVKVVATHGGFVGEDGSTHNALEDLSLMGSLPNLTIFVPLDYIELKQMLTYMISSDGPFYVRLPRGKFPSIHTNSYEFKPGNCDVLKHGNDFCLIGAGYGAILASKSATKLEKELNLSLKVINLSTIKPINQSDLINEIEELNGVIVIEEHNVYCGFGSILAKKISESSPLPMRFIGVENSFGQSGSREDLWNTHGLNYKNLKQKITSLL